MQKGVYQAVKKDGTIYYRSSITYRNKHISLGSFLNEADAHAAYLEAEKILTDPGISLEHKLFHPEMLNLSKHLFICITIIFPIIFLQRRNISLTLTICSSIPVIRSSSVAGICLSMNMECRRRSYPAMVSAVLR